MKHFKSPRQMQRFLPSTIQVANIFTRRRNQDTATTFRPARIQAFAAWAEVTGAVIAARSRLPTGPRSTSRAYHHLLADNLTAPVKMQAFLHVQAWRGRLPARSSGESGSALLYRR
jgi:hypothetical protein